jgi:hypothetical protein
LPRFGLGGIGEGAFLVPGGSVGLPGHIGQRVEPILGAQLDFVDRLVIGALPLLVHTPGAIDVTVRWTVELGGIGFERMRAELLDIDRDRCCEALRAQDIEPRRRAVRFIKEGKLCFARALLDVTNGGVFWMVAFGPAK